MAPEGSSFAVLVTTFCRPEKVLRAIESVLAQTLPVAILIVVNDSPEEDYTVCEQKLSKVVSCTYIKNKRNEGKNGSLNRAFEHLASIQFNGSIILLDDDDWLDPVCVEKFSQAIADEPGRRWFVSNRTLTDGTSLTRNNTGKKFINYFRDCLVTHRFAGDATHCIAMSAIGDARFIPTVKNGEEWFFFSQVASREPSFSYTDFTGTYSDGYAGDGLTLKKMITKEKLQLFRRIRRVLNTEHGWNAPVALYMLLRLIKIFV